MNRCNKRFNKGIITATNPKNISFVPNIAIHIISKSEYISYINDPLQRILVTTKNEVPQHNEILPFF